MIIKTELHQGHWPFIGKSSGTHWLKNKTKTNKQKKTNSSGKTGGAKLLVHADFLHTFRAEQSSSRHAGSFSIQSQTRMFTSQIPTEIKLQTIHQPIYSHYHRADNIIMTVYGLGKISHESHQMNEIAINGHRDTYEIYFDLLITFYSRTL